MNELRPEDPRYPQQVRLIRERLDAGLTVYVQHAEYMTGKRLVIARVSALAREGSFSPHALATEFFLAWVEHGSMWYPEHADWGYIAQKLDIAKWPADAKSIAAFMANILNVGTDKPLVKADEL